VSAIYKKYLCLTPSPPSKFVFRNGLACNLSYTRCMCTRPTNSKYKFEKSFFFFFSELFGYTYTTINAHVRKQLAQQLNVYCNKTVLDEGPEEPHQYQWTYYNAFFFALTTLSTIGEYYIIMRVKMTMIKPTGRKTFTLSKEFLLL